MSLFAEFLAPSAQTVRPGPIDDYWYQSFEPLDGQVRATTKTALTISTLWRGLSVLANTLGMVPLNVLRRLPGGEGKEVDRAHRLHRVLHDQPNTWQTSIGWRQHGMTQAIMRGNYYNRVLRGPGSRIRLQPLPAELVTVSEQTITGELMYEYRPPGEEPITLRGGSDIVHIHGVSLDGFCGVPLLQLMRRGVTGAVHRENFIARFFRSPRMSGFLKFPFPMDPQQRRSYEGSVNTQFALPESQRGVMVLERGGDWVASGMTNEDAELIEAGQFQVEEFARWIGVPAVLLMHADKTSTYASAEQFFTSFLTYDIAHWFKSWEQALERDLLTEPERETHLIRFNLDGLLRGDATARAAFYRTMIELDVFTRNEVRDLEGRNRRDGLDESPPAQAPPREAAVAVRAAERLERKEQMALERMAGRHADPTKDVQVFYSKFVTELQHELVMPRAQAEDYCEGMLALAISDMDAARHRAGTGALVAMMGGVA